MPVCRQKLESSCKISGSKEPLGDHFRLLSKGYLGLFLAQRQISSGVFKEGIKLRCLRVCSRHPRGEVGLILWDNLFPVAELKKNKQDPMALFITGIPEIKQG